MLYDLTARIHELNADRVHDRMVEAAEVLPDVGVVAFNGIPFVGDPPTYFGTPVTSETINQQVRLGLGFGGVLTFMNRKDHSLDRLADVSLAHDHDWAMHSISVTLCFAGCPTFVEMSFARDRRFHLSWVESKRPNWNDPRVFTATGTLKDWRKYLGNRESGDFQDTHRLWLGKAHDVLAPLCPEYLG